MKKLTSLVLALCMLLGGLAYAQETWEEAYSFAPALLRHVFNNTDEPELYLEYYDGIWGDLTRAAGDIVYDTLTDEQRALVNYPDLDMASVHYVAKGSSYHSTSLCYTLLRSTAILSQTYSEALSDGLKPCSKCVGY